MGTTVQFYGNDRNNARLDMARSLLCLFSKSQIEAIIDLIYLRGRGVIDDIYGPNTSTGDPPHIFAVASPDLIPYEDIESLLLGMSTVLMAGLRKPHWGFDEYENLIKEAFGVPSEMATDLAKRIDTIDPDTGKQFPWYENWYRSITGFLRRTLNQVAAIFQTGWEIDQDQENDVDVLYEWVQLGKAVRDLNSRAKLVAAGAYMRGIVPSSQESGDPTETLDEAAEREVGDILGGLMRRNVSSSIAGSWAGMLSKTKMIQKARAKASLTEAGMHQPDGKPMTMKGHALKKAWEKAMTGKLTPALLKGLALGTGAGALAAVAKRLFSKAKGDPAELDALYGDIAEIYGEPIADAWLTGDIDKIAKHVLIEAHDPDLLTTGDPELDERIEEAVVREVAGDPDMEPEVGGLFTRWRIRREKRRLARKKRRLKRRAARRAARLQRKMELERLRNQRRNMSVDDFLNEDEFSTPYDEQIAASTDAAQNPDDQSDIEADGGTDTWEPPMVGTDY